MILFYVLKRVVAFFTRANLYHVFHIVNEDLTVSDMTRVKSLLGSFDHVAHRNLADDDIDLYLGKQICLDRNATVLLGLTLLNTASKHVGHRHTRDADCRHGILQSLKPRLLENDLHLGDLRRSRTILVNSCTS